MTAIYVDGDACPMREEVYRVAGRLGLQVHVVSNGSRPILPPRLPNVHMVLVDQGADAADDWIAARVGTGDICVTADIPLAARCLAAGAQALAPNGKPWTPDNIGSALAGREVARHLRELGETTGGPAPFGKADRVRFLNALDAMVGAALPISVEAKLTVRLCSAASSAVSGELPSRSRVCFPRAKRAHIKQPACQRGRQ